MSVETVTPDDLRARRPTLLCLGGALAIALGAIVTPRLSFPGAGIPVVRLLLIVAVIGLAVAALNQPSEPLERWMALCGVLLVLATIGGLTTAAGLGTLVAFIGAMTCLAGALLVFFPSLLERATATATGHAPAPGWYDDPAGGPGARWWDGRRWAQTAHVDDSSNLELALEDPRVRLPIDYRGTDVRR